MKTLINSFLFLLLAIFLIGCEQAKNAQASKVDKGKSLSPIEVLERDAKKGDLKAQLKLATAYKKGEGVSQSPEQAFNWSLKAAEKQDVDSIMFVADAYELGKGVNRNLSEALKWWKKAAEAGNPIAQYKAANEYGLVVGDWILLTGGDEAGRKQRLELWLALLEKSANAGYLKAKHELGTINLYGVPEKAILIDDGNRRNIKFLLKPDVKKATELLNEAAEKGYWESQWLLACSYQNGLSGITRNAKESEKWWHALDEQSDITSQFEIAKRYEVENESSYKTGSNKWNGSNLTYFYTNQKAAEWYQKAADKGNAAALEALSAMYFDGRGVFKDRKLALNLLTKAADSGNPKAQLRLGLYFYSGEAGVARDYLTAFNYIELAAVQNGKDAAEAKTILGKRYENGEKIGLERDLVLAYAWYNLAVADGDKKAEELRDSLQGRITPQQVNEAQTLSRSWKYGEKIIHSNNESKTELETKELAEKALTTLKQAIYGTAVGISKDGVMITNAHVTENCAELRIPALNKTAKVIVADLVNDLSIIRVDGHLKETATFPKSDDLLQGSSIVVFGFPLVGYLASNGNVTEGIVSSLSGPANNTSLFQITAPIQQGNSGGPVMDNKGHLVGIIRAKADAVKIANITGDIPQNINFAISGRTIKALMETTNINIESGSSFFSFDKNTAEIAALSRKFSYKVECWK